ncbi:MAG: flavin reductase family protein [Dehalococcoidia bacterium]
MSVEGDEFDSREFRRGVWSQTATTVALVTSAWEGRENVMACEWAMMVSASPMRFVISIGPRSQTHEFIEASGEFGLNFCADSQATLSHLSGSYSMRDTDKWALADFPRYRATRIAAPMIEGCPLNVECRVVATEPLGDHTLFIGEAVWARYDAEKQPLLYSAGKYWHLGNQVPKE